MFGRTEFPPIEDRPYFITLGPHAFYWFSLEAPRAALLPRVAGDQQSRAPWEEDEEGAVSVPTIVVTNSWEELVLGRGRWALAEVLPAFLVQRRWFRGKARPLQAARMYETIPVAHNGATTYVTLVQVTYTDGDGETYVLPLGHMQGERADQFWRDHPEAIIARWQTSNHVQRSGILYDALADSGFSIALLDAIAARRRLKGNEGELLASPSASSRTLLGPSGTRLEPTLVRSEQSNTSVIYGDRLILKLYRRLEQGVNPDLEIPRYLTERGFGQVPAFAGAIEYVRDRGDPGTIATLQAYVPNQGDAWQYTLDALVGFFERAIAAPAEAQVIAASTPAPATRTILELAERETPPLAHEMIGAYLDAVWQLGQRTAELHLALAVPSEASSFSPEPFTTHYQRSLYQSLRTLVGKVFPTLRTHLSALPPAALDDATFVLAAEGNVLSRLQAVMSRRLQALRIRSHGDYHLGQVLYTGKDFVILDFEGEPARPLSERRMKRPAPRDVAGMLRSFHYATRAAITAQTANGQVREEDAEALEPWAQFWQLWVSVTFWQGYSTTVRPSDASAALASSPALLPAAREDVAILLDAFLLDKAVYELGYELNNRPVWVTIPLRGLRQLLSV
jgi:maltose alpha-D-glucosyltransferase/alpha-amylase